MKQWIFEKRRKKTILEFKFTHKNIIFFLFSKKFEQFLIENTDPLRDSSITT